MQTEVKEWIEEAVDQCKRASDKQVTLLIRSSAEFDNDIVVTNAASPEIIGSLAFVMNGPGTSESESED